MVVRLRGAPRTAPPVAAILADPAPHRGQTYTLFGGAELTFPQIAAEMSAALGRPVRYQPVPAEAFAAVMKQTGVNDFALQHVTAGGVVDFADGRFAGTNDVVERVGGRPPTTVRQFVTSRAAAFAGPPPSAVA